MSPKLSTMLRSESGERHPKWPHWRPLALAEAYFAAKGVDEFDLCLRPFGQTQDRSLTIVLWRGGVTFSTTVTVLRDIESQSIANPWPGAICEAVESVLQSMQQSQGAR